MVLDFGLIGAQDPTLQTADYRSAGSHQAENVKSITLTASGTYTEIHTVTTGKTYYVSGICIATALTTSALCEIATGLAASEVNIFSITTQTNTPIIMNLPTPMKFSSGTRITVRANTATSTRFNLIGWEE